MPFAFTPDERDMLDQIPKQDLEDLAIELDLVLDEVFDADALLLRALPALIDRIRSEGLPLSRFNKMDLADLSESDLWAIASLAGHTGRPTPDALIRTCKKASRYYQRNRPRSAVVLVLPLLLAPLARAAREGMGA